MAGMASLDKLSPPTGKERTSNVENRTSKARMSLKTKNRCGKLEGKAGMSMKRKIVSCPKAGMLLKRKDVGVRPYGVGGEEQDSGFGIQESGTEDAKWVVVSVVIPSEEKNSPLEIKGLMDS